MNNVYLYMFIKAQDISRRKNKKLVTVVASEERDCVAEEKGREGNGIPFVLLKFHAMSMKF